MITQPPDDNDYDRGFKDGFDEGFFAAFRLLTDEVPPELDELRRQLIEKMRRGDVA